MSNFFLQEDYHAEVMSQVCTILLGPNSIVLRECQVGTSEMPHGIFDIVAGKLEEKNESYIAVTVDSEEFKLEDPKSIEAKLPNAMPIVAISELID